MGSAYNINELLDMRKHTEERMKEAEAAVASNKLYSIVEKEKDHKLGTEKTVRSTEVKTLNDVMQEYSVLADELAKISTAVTKYNANVLKDKLFQRDAVRGKIAYLKKVRTALPMEARFQRSILHQDKEGTVQASLEVTATPFFDRMQVDKYLDQLAKEERKLNTEIQKLNLEQKIEL